jgi:hypothetical protein
MQRQMGSQKRTPQELRVKIQLLRYQWESLRTNAEYVRDYKRYRKIWENPRIEYARFWYRLERFFHQKYGISPLNPAVPFPAKCPDTVKRKLTDKEETQSTLWMYFVLMGKAAYCFSPALEDAIRALLEGKPEPNPMRTKIPDNELQERGSIFIAVNLGEPISRIMKGVRSIVVPLQQRKRRITRNKPERVRLLEYERYFKVHQLRERGWSWSAIAKRFYPGDCERDPYYARRKARRDCERWKNVWLQLRHNALTNSIPIFSLGLHSPGILSQQQYFESCKARYEKEKQQRLADSY